MSLQQNPTSTPSVKPAKPSTRKPAKFDAATHKRGDPLPKRGTKAYDNAIMALRRENAARARAKRAKLGAAAKDGSSTDQEKKREYNRLYRQKNAARLAEQRAAKKNGHNGAQLIPLDLIPDKMPAFARERPQKAPRGAHGALPTVDTQARMVIVYELVKFLNG